MNEVYYAYKDEISCDIWILTRCTNRDLMNKDRISCTVYRDIDNVY